MENKEAILKMEDPISSSSFIVDHNLLLGSNSNSTFTGLLDYGDEGEKGPLGFMDLLGMPQDFGFSEFDISLQVAAASSSSSLPYAEEPLMEEKKKKTTTQASTVVEPSGLLENITPATPNSSSISSDSSGAQNEEQSKTADEDIRGAGEEEDQQHKTKKKLQPKKTSQKRPRQPRFAFMTKSDVDHLEDGYRWRKYGQKAVKNSPFPRSYYRCTSASCNVKKRVERSLIDPSIVVTTYEGQHIHQSPMIPRPSPAAALLQPPGGHGGFSVNAAAPNPFAFPMQYMAALTDHDRQPQFMNFNYPTGSTGIPTAELQERRFCSSALLGDHGLLEDILPSVVRKYE